jgi:hypothetical protein
MTALANYQNGQTFPAISTTMLSTIAAGLNKSDTALIGGPPPGPHVIEALLDAVVALDQQVNG